MHAYMYERNLIDGAFHVFPSPLFMCATRNYREAHHSGDGEGRKKKITNQTNKMSIDVYFQTGLIGFDV